MIELEGTVRFEIRRCLGSGSFGVVYEALDRERSTLVALKRPHVANAQGLYLFKQEFRSLADITHPNLITLFELLGEEDRWFFTMELVEGVHLLDYLRWPSEGMDSDSTDGPTGRWAGAGELPAEASWKAVPDVPALPSAPPDYLRVRGVLQQLMEGLIALHEGGKLHRDLKPSNVLVTRGGRVVILDFGLATDLESSAQQDSPGIAGTLSYASPEQIGGGTTTAASDYYSVGVLLYQVLTGRLPFFGDSRALLAQKLQRDPLAPGLLVPGTPGDLEQLCMALLNRDPAGRPRGAEVLACLRAASAAQARPVPELRSRAASLVGREEELAVLHRGFRLARDGRSVAALLHGDSGTGKSFLAREFLRQIARTEERAVLLQGRCYEQESMPFKAVDSLVDALSEHLKRLSPAEARGLLPRNIQALARLFPVLNQVPLVGETQPEAGIPDPQEWRRRAFGALRELLRQMALRSPVVMVIDDMQWGDLDSAALLAELLRPPDPPQILLLFCYRSEEANSSLVLQELLASLSTSASLLLDVELRALTPLEARELARMLLGPDTPGAQEQADWIAAESSGSPFFVQELAQHIRRLIRDEREDTGRRLDDYIRIRVEALPQASRSVLNTLAVAGYPLDWEILHQAAQVDPGSLGTLTALRSGHLIRMRGSGRRKVLETYHDRIRESVLRCLGTWETQAIHGALAAVLEAASSRDARALTRHFELAGNANRAAQYAVIAAEQAESALAFDQAAVFYRKALNLRLATDAEAPKLWKQLGDALANAGRSSEAAEAYLRATEGAPEAEVNRLQRRAAEEFLRSGQIETGITTLERVLAAVGTRLPTTRLGTLASIVWNRLRLKLRGMAWRERPAPEIPKALLERVDIYWAVVMGLGPVDALQSLDFLTRQLRLTLDAGEPFRVVRAFANEMVYLASAGNRALEKTRDLEARTLALAVRIGHPNPRSRAYIAAGFAATLQGRWKVSAELLERAEETLKQHCTGMDYELHLAQHQGLLDHFVMGDLKVLRERLPLVLQEAREKGDLVATTNLRVSLSYILALAQDDPGRSRQDLRAAIEAWSGKDFQIQHYHHLVSRVNTELYAGDVRAAEALLSGNLQGLRHSLLLNVQLMRVTILELQARVALARMHAAGSPKEARRLRRQAERAIRALHAERTPYGIALAFKLQALGAWRSPETPALLLRAERMFDACDMTLHRMAVRHSRGTLLGKEGHGLVATADAWMRDQGILNPPRFAAMHLPFPGSLEGEAQGWP